MKWIVPVALLQTVLPDTSGHILAALKVSYQYPGQISEMLEMLEREALSQAGIPSLEKTGLFMLRAVLPCGNAIMFKRASDVPRSNVPCPCGDPMHYLVAYVKVPEPVQVAWP